MRTDSRGSIKIDGFPLAHLPPRSRKLPCSSASTSTNSRYRYVPFFQPSTAPPHLTEQYLFLVNKDGHLRSRRCCDRLPPTHPNNGSRFFFCTYFPSPIPPHSTRLKVTERRGRRKVNGKPAEATLRSESMCCNLAPRGDSATVRDGTIVGNPAGRYTLG